MSEAPKAREEKFKTKQRRKRMESLRMEQNRDGLDEEQEGSKQIKKPSPTSQFHQEIQLKSWAQIYRCSFSRFSKDSTVSGFFFSLE